MTTIADLINDVRRMAYGSMTESVAFVGSGGYTAGATSLVLDTDIQNVTAGAVISSGLNVWVVRSVNAATRTLTVAPGYTGAPEKDCAEGDFVYLRPRVTDWYVFSSLNDEIRKLSSPDTGLFTIGSWTTSVDIIDQTYPVPNSITNLTRVVRTRYLVPGYTDVWYDLPASAFRRDPVNGIIQVTRDMPAGACVQFIYTGAFEEATDLTDDPVADCGLAETMIDIPPLGAVVSLLLTTEMRRNQVQTQGDSRKAAEVLQGGNIGVSKYFRQEYLNRVDEERSRLLARLPTYKGFG